MKNNKSQGLSVTTIIIAAIALVVLVVLIAIFTGRFGKFTGGVESTEEGFCVTPETTGENACLTEAKCKERKGNWKKDNNGKEWKDCLLSNQGCCLNVG